MAPPKKHAMPAPGGSTPSPDDSLTPGQVVALFAAAESRTVAETPSRVLALAAVVRKELADSNVAAATARKGFLPAISRKLFDYVASLTSLRQTVGNHEIVNRDAISVMDGARQESTELMKVLRPHVQQARKLFPAESQVLRDDLGVGKHLPYNAIDRAEMLVQLAKGIRRHAANLAVVGYPSNHADRFEIVAKQLKDASSEKLGVAGSTSAAAAQIDRACAGAVFALQVFRRAVENAEFSDPTIKDRILREWKLAEAESVTRHLKARGKKKGSSDEQTKPSGASKESSKKEKKAKKSSKKSSGDSKGSSDGSKGSSDGSKGSSDDSPAPSGSSSDSSVVPGDPSGGAKK